MIAMESAARRQFSGKFLFEKATLAQLVERLIRNQQVAGSSPAGGSTKNKEVIHQMRVDRVVLRVVLTQTVSKFSLPRYVT